MCASSGKLFLSGQKGFTVLEVLLAFGLFALIGVSILNTFQANTRGAGIVDEKVIANSLATSFLENIRKSAYSDNYTAETANVSVPGGYSVSIATYGSNNSVDWSGPPSTGETLQRIILIIEHGEKQVLRVCTYRAN